MARRLGGFSWFGKGGARVREVEWSPSSTSGGQRGFSWLGKRDIRVTRVEYGSAPVMKDLRRIVHLRHLGYNRPVMMCGILKSHYSQLVS